MTGGHLAIILKRRAVLARPMSVAAYQVAVCFCSSWMHLDVFGGSEKKDKDNFYLGIKGNVDLTVEYKPGDHCYMYLEYEVYCALLRNFGSTFRNINIWR